MSASLLTLFAVLAFVLAPVPYVAVVSVLDRRGE